MVGSLVGTAMQRGVSLSQLDLADYQAAHPELDESVYDVLGVQKAVESFRSYGSTAPAEVAKQVDHWKKQLGV